MSHVRFCPRVEEVEPRLLPDTAWHALVQEAKLANNFYKTDLKPQIARLTDPFCNGTDPGPCARPGGRVSGAGCQGAGVAGCQARMALP